MKGCRRFQHCTKDSPAHRSSSTHREKHRARRPNRARSPATRRDLLQLNRSATCPAQLETAVTLVQSSIPTEAVGAILKCPWRL
ncbi:MAG: hypothetical protein NZM04_02375, partial [Methylacidiphilales bacterium]|nr:hypothetical protein [Candidatus Methylacidiphilales bacterium]